MTAHARPRRVATRLARGLLLAAALALPALGAAGCKDDPPPPQKVAPLAPDRLLHPDAGVWIRFAYTTDFKKGDAPESLVFLAVVWADSVLRHP